VRIILDRLEAAGYSISFELYNATNFGAPQILERVVMIGKLGREKVPYMTLTNDEHNLYNLPGWKTIGEALEALNIRHHHYIEFPKNRLKFYKILSEGQYWKDLPPDAQKEAMEAKLKLWAERRFF